MSRSNIGSRESITENNEYHELPKEYCDDYTLDELAKKAAKTVRLTSNDRYRICTELGLPKYNPIDEESLGYPRTKIIAIAKKIESKAELDATEQRIVHQWNQNHDPIKERIDMLAEQFISGEQLSETDLKFLDKELFNKYCRCVLKRKSRDHALFAERNLDKIMQRLPDQQMDKAKEIVQTGLAGRSWDQLTDASKDEVLAKLMPIFLGLTIGGCKASVYQKSRKIKPRNRECDYELRQAEVFLE